MKQLLLIFGLINLGFNIVKAQEHSINKLLNKYWGIYSGPQLSSINEDTLLLKNVSSIKAAMTYPYWGGFIFYSNGRFKTKLKRRCAEGGIEQGYYEGNWKQYRDTLILKISDHQYWNLKILNLAENKLLIKYWLRKTAD
jgi:hypothetical protein